MKNISLILQETEFEAATYNTISNVFLLLDEINYLLLKIKFCENNHEANIYFDILDQIQLMVAKLQYKYRLSLPADLKQFIIDFNLLHDPRERNRLFSEIKKNQYIYAINYKRILLRLLDDIEKNPIKTNVEYKLNFLHDAINSLFSEIQSCESLESADSYFELLMQVNDLISRLINIHEIKVSHGLLKFYKDFDRIDDKEWRKYIFNKIKNENYSLVGKPALDG